MDEDTDSDFGGGGAPAPLQASQDNSGKPKIVARTKDGAPIRSNEVTSQHWTDKESSEEKCARVSDAALKYPLEVDRNPADILTERPELVPEIDKRAGRWLRSIARHSILSNVKGPASELVGLLPPTP